MSSIFMSIFMGNILHCVQSIITPTSLLNTLKQRLRSLLLVLFSLSLLGLANSALALTHAGTVEGKFEVNEQGAATYSVPVEVPPGIAGLHPELAISYDSRDGNGPLGIGWSLSGLSSIHRCPQTLVQDGNVHGVDFSAKDRFCLDGQRLVAVNGVYGADGTEYRTELESNVKIVSYGVAGTGPASFSVWTPKGRKMEYGTTADSFVEANVAATGAARAEANIWAVSKVTDVSGNAMTYSYFEDTANGYHYIQRIDYGFIPGGSTMSVRFVFKPRTDRIEHTTSGSKYVIAGLLDSVTSYLNDTVVKTFSLTYGMAEPLNYSRIVKIGACTAEQCNKDISLVWEDTRDQAESWTFSGHGVGDSGWKMIDLFGDGRPVYYTHSTSGTHYATRLNADGTAQSWTWSGHGVGDSGWQMADLFGDGRQVYYTHSTNGTHYATRLNADGTAKNWIWSGHGVGDSGWRMADLFGTGRNVYYTHSTSGAHYVTSFLPTKSDILRSIEAGLGENYTINYKALTDSSVYVKQNDAVYPVRDIQSPMYVVSSFTKSNGLGGTYSHSYSYEGAKTHVQGRGFLGFSKVKMVDDLTGISKTTNYRQDFPFIGAVQSSDTVLANGTTVISHTANSWTDLYAVDTKRFNAKVISSTVTTRELDNTLVTTVTTSNTYDPGGNIATLKVDSNDGYVKTTSNTYAPTDTANWILGQLLNVSIKSDAPGGLSATRTSAFAYDGTTGLLVKEVVEPGDPELEMTTTYTYDSYGNQASKTVTGYAGATYPVAAAVSTTTVDYSGLSDSLNPAYHVTHANALGHSETRTIDPRWGRPVSSTGPNGLTTTWEYDSLGRKLRENRPAGSWTSLTYTYCDPATVVCPYNSPMSVTKQKAGNSPATVYFDILGREIMSESVGFDGRTIHKQTAYNSKGQIDRVSLPYFAGAVINWHRYDYDVLGRPTKEIFPNNTTAGITYNGLTTTYSNGKGQTTVKIKDSQGNLIVSTDNLNNSNTYRYDAFGNLLSVSDAAGNTVSMTYDLRGNKLSMNDPDMGSWYYRYNALGKLVYEKDARLQVRTLEYDVLGRMIKRSEVEGISIWNYDTAANGVGKLAKSTTPDNISRSYSYDAQGRPITTTTTVGSQAYAMATSYGAYSRVDKTTYPSGFAVRNIYNSYGYLSELQDAANTARVYWQAGAMDASGRLTSQAFHNNAMRTLKVFDDLTGHVKEILTDKVAGTADLQNLHFNFDAIGNLTSREDWNQTSLTEVFTYDGLNRLSGVMLNGIVSKSYGYDSIGNITYKSDVGNYAYTGAGPHAVTTAGAVNYTYDANGNQISGDGRNLTYTSFNKPSTATKGTVNSSFYYDAGRNRIKKVSIKSGQATTTIYLGKAFEEISKPDGVIENKHYVTVGSATLVVTTRTAGAGDTRYLHKDHLGSTDVITDEAGNIIERLSFGAFGARRNAAGWTDATSFISSLSTRGYTGHNMDDDIGLVDMNARMYDAKLGRFLQPDSYVQYPETSQGFNRYTYVYNNPLSYTDPTGHFSLKRLWKKVKKLAKKAVRLAIKVFRYGTIAGWIMYSKPVRKLFMKYEWARQLGAAAATYFGGAAGAAAFQVYLVDIHGGSVNDMYRAFAMTYIMTSLSHGNKGAKTFGNFVKYAAKDAVNQAWGRAVDRFAQKRLGISGFQFNLVLQGLSWVGNEIYGSRFSTMSNKQGDKVGFIDGFASRRGEGYGSLVFDSIDIVLGFQGISSASARDAIKSGGGLKLEGYSLGALEVNNLVGNGFFASGNATSLPLLNVAAGEVNVTNGSWDIVNGGALNSYIFAPGANIESMNPGQFLSYHTGSQYSSLPWR